MKRLDQIEFNGSPILLAAWPGMGNVGLITVDYLRIKLDMQTFAEFDMSPFFIPDSIVVKDGIAQFPEIPSSVFYYHRDPDIIIFESNAQVGGRDGITVIKTILDAIKPFNVKQIFTFAAFAQPMSYQESPQVLVTCNNPVLLQSISEHGVIPMPDGYIAGLNGLLLGVAASRKIEAACLLGTIPNYAVNLNYPKASVELVKTISSFISIKPDMGELESSAEEMDQQLASIEERIREFFPNVNKEEDAEMSDLDEEKVPHYVMEKIERLFLESKKDRAAASELKKELDRWNLFELYEDRFLDLFKDDPKNKK